MEVSRPQSQAERERGLCVLRAPSFLWSLCFRAVFRSLTKVRTLCAVSDRVPDLVASKGAVTFSNLLLLMSSDEKCPLAHRRWKRLGGGKQWCEKQQTQEGRAAVPPS